MPAARGMGGRGRVVIGCAAALVWAPIAMAGEVDVLFAKVNCDAESKCRVVATLRHADVGTSHYADAFLVLAPDERVLATRVLRHPHVHEQPFTRSLDGVTLPPDLDTVIVAGRDNVHGTGGRTFTAKVVRAAPEPEAPGAAKAPTAAAKPAPAPPANGGD